MDEIDTQKGQFFTQHLRINEVSHEPNQKKTIAQAKRNAYAAQHHKGRYNSRRDQLNCSWLGTISPA
jgi:hypothetical protein